MDFDCDVYFRDNDDIGSENNSDDDILEEEDPPSPPRQKGFTILTESDVRKRQKEVIMDVSSTLSITAVSSTFLLSHYNWNVGRATEQWFEDEGKVRETAGLPIVETQIADSNELFCTICFETHDAVSAASCGHRFCNECWRSYVRISIIDGPGCLTLRCPAPSCKAAIEKDMIETLTCNEDKEKYQRHLLRSYIEANKTMKWCPSPSCELVVDLAPDNESYNVLCNCGNFFCWNCTEEAHRPVDCDTMRNWIVKNSSEGENTNWIIANSKSCPKCKTSIEKNQGCMHMTCPPPCRFEFCWLCLTAWSQHGDRTGGFYACNGYTKAKKGGKLDESEIKRKRAKAAVDRFMHYYERWSGNSRSMKKAMEDLGKLNRGKLDELSEELRVFGSQMNFLTEAWVQIVECRRVLKCTYVYGYYLEGTKTKFFEHLQGRAESELERLHHCAETELEAHIDSEVTPSIVEFRNFRQKLSHLTRVTRTYFDNLVEALENGLEDLS